MGNDALLSGSTKDVEKWADFIYDRIKNRYIPHGVSAWFHRGTVSLQEYVTHERPQFKAYYDVFYQVFNRLIREGMDYDIIYAASFTKPHDE